MNKETSYVAFSTQKGGAGKTTLTVLVASYLHYVKGYNVAVVDCDFPQYSIHDMRRRDMKAVMEDDYYKMMAYEQLKRLKKKPYLIKCSRAEDAVETAKSMTEQCEGLDFVFFDLPGTINNPDVVRTIARMDYIFTPIIADRVVMESSIKFATIIKEQMVGTGKSDIKGLYLVWNMVDGREKTDLYEAYEKACKEFSLPVLKTFLPDSKRFRKETATERKALFRSTAFPADRTLVRGSNIDKLVEEIIEIIKK
ncbi:MAG: ParA family protein [Prevotella sp.]|nr:ParA family protein [Prevotella sp.]